MPDLASIIEQTTNLSVQQNETLRGNVFPVFWMARAGLSLSPWWSKTRDVDLRSFWKKTDHLAGAIYTMEARMTSIPFKIIARNQSESRHVREAEEATQKLVDSAQFGDGWINFFSKWLEDYLTQDNGAFAEIIGFGDPTGPILGSPLSIAHLDSLRCQRTGDPEYPVIYEADSGRMYKLHFTRVMMAAQMSSPIQEMYGVGFCGVSRCVNVAQNLLDVLIYKQEKLGSRPHRTILITQGGLDPNDVRDAFTLAEGSMDSQGLSRYSKIVVAGSSSLQDANITSIELSKLPDGFDEQTSVTLGMATIALAFGVDARELFPALQSGATRADALLQHLKQRGKGPGQIIQTVENLFNQKYLPQHLQMVFDFQDDAQDRQAADTKKVRADSRLQNKNVGVMDQRTMREQMVTDGDITREQFERMELTDGRLPDGSSIFTLFYSQDYYVSNLLDVGTDDPLNTEMNDKDAIVEITNEKIAEAIEKLAKERDPVRKLKINQCIAALVYLREYYHGKVSVEQTMGISIFGMLKPGQDIQSQQQAAFAAQQAQAANELATLTASQNNANQIDNRVRGKNPINPDMNIESSPDTVNPALEGNSDDDPEVD